MTKSCLKIVPTISLLFLFVIQFEVQGLSLAIDPSKQYQTIEGFGANIFDDTSTYKDQAYLSKIIDTLGLNIILCHYASNDSSYDSVSFNLQKKYLLALKNKANSSGEPLKIFATIQSPPSRYLDPHPTTNTKALLPQYYPNYADFVVKAIENYKNAGCNLDGISLQKYGNYDVYIDTTTYYVYTPELYRDMFKAVGPAVKAIFPSIKLFGTEIHIQSYGHLHNTYTSPLLNNDISKQTIDAIAYRTSTDPSSRQLVPFSTWTSVSAQDSTYNKPTWMTGTEGYTPSWDGAMLISQDIYRALKYGKVSAWLFGNLSGNSIDLATLTTVNYQIFRFYAMRHFSRFIRPGMKMIDCTDGGDPDILPVAFIDPISKKLTIVILNIGSTSKQLSFVNYPVPSIMREYLSTSVNWKCVDQGNVSTKDQITLPGSSIMTLCGTMSDTIPLPEVHSLPGDTTVDTSPVLTWKGVPGATGYKVKLINNSKICTLYVASSDTFVKVPTILSLGSVIWSVSSSLAYSAYSTSTKFTVVSSVPKTIKYPTWPTLDRKPSVSWISVYKATEYKISIDTNISFSKPIVEGFSNGSTAFKPLNELPCGRVYWKVSCNYDYSKFSNVDSIRIISSFSGPQIIPYPFDTTTDRRPQLRWYRNSDAQQYRIMITNADMAVIIVDSIVADTSFTLNRDLHSSKIHWSVSSDIDFTLFSNYDAFCVISLPTPQIKTPRDMLITSYSDSLSWSRSYDPSSSVRYEFNIAESDSFKVLFLTDTINDTIARINSLKTKPLPNRVLFWRVRAINDRGLCSAWSQVKSFLIKSASIINGKESVLRDDLTVIPNQKCLKIAYSLKKDSRVNLSIYNAKGVLLKRVDKPTPAGYHVYNWEFSSSESRGSGIYIVKLKTRDFAKAVSISSSK